MLRFWMLLSSLAVGSSADGGDYRLPTDFVPTSYELQILPHLDEPGPPFYFEGHVTINLTVAAESASIVLHSGSSLTVWEAAVVSATSGELPLNGSATLDEDREFFEVQLAEPAQAGDQLALTLLFSGELPVDMKGFYLSSYSHDGATRYLAATKFEPTYARRAFPCFDEPALKAAFTITIIAPPGFTAMSGTQATSISSSSSYPGHTEYVFAPLPVLSTYLVSWMVFEPETYATITLMTSDVNKVPSGPLGVASTKSLRKEWPLPLRVGQAALRELNAIFNGTLTYYSFMDQLSLVALPDFISGAMENWGMITFRERRMLMSDSSSSTETIQSVATTITHEIVHQWFGDLVSPAWWTYLWLNEGFATYWSYHLDLALDEDDPWHMADQFVVLELQAALRADASPSTHPMTYDRTTPAQVQAIFDSVNYEKAASVIRMFQHILGKTAFQEGLKQYLQDNKFGAVTEVLLFSALDSQIAPTRGFQTMKLGDIFLTWSNNAGYPLVTLTRDYNNGTAYLTQARFYDDPDDAPQEASAPWMVPITVAWDTKMFEDTTPGQVMLTEGPLELFNVTNDPDHWVMINVQQAGYYRVQYDERNWQLLVEQLYTDPTAIHPLSRAQLVDDALSLASAGQLNYSLALNLTRYLTREQNPLPWMAALPNFSLLYKWLANSDIQRNLLAYLKELLEPVMQYLGGFEGRSNLSHVEAVLHSQLLPWACRVDISYCTTTAIQEFSWISESLSRSVPANRRSVVYCEGLATTPSDAINDTFNVMWELFTDSVTPPNEKNTILNAFGCITEEKVVNSLLQKVVNKDGVRLQDVQTAFSSVISSSQGAIFALNFLKSNEESVKAVLDEIGKTESILNSMAQWLPADKQTELIEAVTEWNVTETLYTAINSTNRWMERNEPALREWLQQEAPISSALSIYSSFILLISVTVINAYLIFS